MGIKNPLTKEKLQYLLTLGFTLVRIRPNKVPIDPDWNSRPPALSYDPSQLYGVIPPENIVIADVDTKDGKVGLESWKRFVQDCPELDPALGENPKLWANVITGSGGYHFYIGLEGLKSSNLPKNHPNYPDIEFLRHGKEQGVAGGQQLNNGWYSFDNFMIHGKISSFPPLPIPKVDPGTVRHQETPKKIKYGVFQNPSELSDDINYSEETIRQLLTYIKSDDYEIWYRVAFYLMGTSFSEETQYNLFDEWSSKSPKYSEEGCKRKWASLRSDFDTQSHEEISIATLILHAKLHSPESHNEIYELLGTETTDALIGRFCEINSKQGASYYDLVTRAMYKESSAQAFLSPLLDHLKLTTGKKYKLQDLKNKGMITLVVDMIYNPKKPSPMFLDSHGGVYLNLFSHDDFPKTIESINITSTHTQHLDFYINHVTQICSEKYTQTILDFFKFIRQHPGDKVRWMPVIEGGVRTGKGLLLEVIRHHVIGDKNYRAINTKDFLSDNNSWAVGSLLVQIEELLIRGKGSAEAMNVIKTLLTNPTISRVEKYMTTREVQNFTSYFALTNHLDCLRHADDGRYFAIKSPIRTPDDISLQGFQNTQAYYNHLATLGAPRNPDGVIFQNYFSTSPVSSSFSPDVVPPSDFDLFKNATLKNASTNNDADLIDFTNYLAQTKALPLYIDIQEIEDICTRGKDLSGIDKYTKYEYHKNNTPEAPDFPSAEGGITLKYLRTFGRRIGYKAFSGWLYLGTLNDEKAKETIRKTRNFPDNSDDLGHSMKLLIKKLNGKKYL